jgi:hypothetical protein
MNRLTNDAVAALPIRPQSRSEDESSPTGIPLTNSVDAGFGLSPNIAPGDSDYEITAALSPYTDYILVRLPHRGVTATGDPDPSTSAFYRFIINPSEVSVQKNTQDSQTLTRSGWVFGVWGEGYTQITLQGKTAGQYFYNGLTDSLQQYTFSYRNLHDLLQVFQNNGYTFQNEAELDTSRVKIHTDVELTVGNFIWYGMFDELAYSQDAENPFLCNFSLSFTAWKERYRKSSPYQNSFPNNIARGHTFSHHELVTSKIISLSGNSVSSASGNSASLSESDSASLTPAQKAALQENNLPSTNSIQGSYVGVSDIINPQNSILF